MLYFDSSIFGILQWQHFENCTYHDIYPLHGKILITKNKDICLHDQHHYQTQ